MILTIKLPIKEGARFKLQSRGNFKAKQFKTAIGLLSSMEGLFCPSNSDEKMAVVVKRYIGTTLESENQSLLTTDREYLIYTTSCFLEDFLSKESLVTYLKRWIKHNDTNN